MFPHEARVSWLREGHIDHEAQDLQGLCRSVEGESSNAWLSQGAGANLPMPLSFHSNLRHQQRWSAQQCTSLGPECGSEPADASVF